MSRTRFDGRTAVVTAAGAGIGRSTAEQLLAEGARVIAGDIAADRLEDLVSANPGAALVPVVADVATQDGADALLAAADGRVDVLCNVAGIMDGFLPAVEIDDATWDRVLAVNVTSVMRLMRAVLPGMIEAGKGSIVNVSSEAALRGAAAGLAYTASKHAVAGMTKQTAFAYGPQGIRVNAVAPGPVKTSIEGSMKSAHMAARIGPIMGAMLTGAAEPEELSQAIVWLASDDASNVNGTTVVCDGGWSAI
ncbi:SDR family oxidoreductase [Cellulomonas sp. NPDC089187]|uniref:SDR family NAD(P)-dependent oxidoreductase n=1 Tax=Cellulomonas sp. NPDC089187 TaxID=3154970 RepID=UPI0034418EDE